MRRDGSSYYDQESNFFFPKVILILTGVEIFVAACFYGYWGFKASGS